MTEQELQDLGFSRYDLEDGDYALEIEFPKLNRSVSICIDEDGKGYGFKAYQYDDGRLLHEVEENDLKRLIARYKEKEKHIEKILKYL